MQLVLSIFPGIDLLGRGFEAEGFCVVRGPDLLFGGDVRDFHLPVGKFDGVIGGPPCQDFSGARRTVASGNGLEMLSEFARVVTEAKPMWYLMENVARVPDVEIDHYSHQRFSLDARECGVKQSRLRHFQYGDLRGFVVIVDRQASIERSQAEPCCMASEGKRKKRRDWARFCSLQGLPGDFSLPGFKLSECYKAVGNGVPLPMAVLVARAVKNARMPVGFRLCACGCGRPVYGKQMTANDACRKRLQRKRELAGMTAHGMVTLPLSL